MLPTDHQFYPSQDRHRKDAAPKAFGRKTPMQTSLSRTRQTQQVLEALGVAAPLTSIIISTN